MLKKDSLSNFAITNHAYFSYHNDLFRKTKTKDSGLSNIYAQRKRFRIVGMGYFHPASKIENESILLFYTGRSHLVFLKTNEAYLTAYRIGYKNRILAVRAQIKKTSLFYKHILQTAPVNIYRRKGIAFFHSKFRYKEGKKKFA